MQNFKKQKGIIDISEQGKSFLEGVTANDQKISDINMQLAVLDEVQKYVLSKDKQPGIVPATLGVDDNMLSSLLQNLYKLEMEYEKEKKTTGKNNPLLSSLQSQIDKITPDIIENIKNQRQSLVAAHNNLNIRTNKFSSMMSGLPQKERELVQISRQQAIKNDIYTFLLKKREETALSFASNVADSRIVDTAQTGLIPVSPQKKNIYITAIIAALAVGVSIIALKEFLHKKISFKSEIEEILPWPVIGELSYMPSPNSIVVADGQRNIVAEQFKQIRTRLAYFGINSSNKTLLITSSVSQEGKSFIAANLALSLALTGKKVVLLELDLRKPRLSPLFNKGKDEGFTNYIIGKSEISDIVKTTEQHRNLFFIPAGPIPPNPSELILSQKVDLLFESLNKTYDYIIIDTAPVVPVTDAEILTKYADATLFVVRQNFTPHEELRKIENNEVSGLKNVSVVFNAVKKAAFTKYDSNYYGYLNNELIGMKTKTLNYFRKKVG